MRKRLILLWIVALVFLSCRKRAEYSSGEAAFKGECSKCHKINGQGGSKGPDLTRVFEKRDEQYFRSYTMDPRSIKGDGTMPPAKISEKELALVIEYLKQKSGSH